MKKGVTGRGRKTRKNMKGGGWVKNFRPNYVNMYANVLNKTQKKGLNSRTGINIDKVYTNYERYLRAYTPGINNNSYSPENYASSKIMKQNNGYYLLILENLIDEYLWNYVIYPFIEYRNTSGSHSWGDSIKKAREEQAKKEYYEKYQRNPDNDAVEFAIQVMDKLMKDKYILYGSNHVYYNSKYKLDKCSSSEDGKYYHKINSSDDENTRICKEVNNIKNKIANQILNPGFFSWFF